MTSTCTINHVTEVFFEAVQKVTSMPTADYDGKVLAQLSGMPDTLLLAMEMAVPHNFLLPLEKLT